MRCVDPNVKPETKEVHELTFRMLDYLEAAKMFYGLALETGFKGTILRDQPGEIEFKMTADGTGKVQSVAIESFGVSIRDGHNLERLASMAGILKRGDGAVFQEDSDFQALREILLHLGDAVRWRVRYPVPTSNNAAHVAAESVPAKVFGHYIRDWIDPVLDHLHGLPRKDSTSGDTPASAT
jgi:hypothetical protein